MKKSSYLTVSNENIHLVAYRLKQFIYRMGTIAEKSVYPSTVKKVSLLGKGIHDVTESMTSYISANDFTLEVDTNYPNKGDKFIRLTSQKKCHAMLLQKGCKIKITTMNVYIRQPRLAMRKDTAYPLEIWKIGDADKCYNQTERNKYESDM